MLKTIIQFGLSALFLLLISISLFAESKDDDEKTVKVKNITWEEDEGGILTRGIGFSGGILAGNGFSYRRQPPKGHGYQFSGIYLMLEDWHYFKIAAAWLYSLARTRLTSFYIITGFSYKYVCERDSRYITVNNQTVREEYWKTSASRLAFGVGPGISTRKLIYERIWGSVDLPLTVYDGKLLLMPMMSVHYMLP